MNNPGCKPDSFNREFDPFGMMMPGREYQAQPSRFGFNGKENDNDVKGFGNQQDYGMRIYDPRIGRFLSVDPVTRNYPSNSPYSYAENEPISNVDLDGLEKTNSTSAAIGAGVDQYTSDKKRQSKGVIRFLTSKEPYRNLWNYTKDWGRAVTGDKTAVHNISVKTTEGITNLTWAMINGIVEPATFLSTIHTRSFDANLQGITYYGLQTLEVVIMYRVFEAVEGGGNSRPTGNVEVRLANGGTRYGEAFQAPVNASGLFRSIGTETATFIEGTTPGKVAVIGRGMDRVRKVANRLKNPEVFKASDEALAEWDKLLRDNKGKIPDKVVEQTLIFKENQQWIKSVKEKGYSILDIGGDSQSTFYNMERQTIYGKDKK